MEVLFALLLFCKSLWVDKYTGETISSILLAHQVKTALVFLGGGWGAEKLCSLRLCIALSTVLCASGVAQKSVAVPGLLDARTCCTFWCNSLHFDSCCCSQLEMEAGRNGLVEGMAGGNGSSWLLGLCLRGEGGNAAQSGRFSVSLCSLLTHGRAVVLLLGPDMGWGLRLPWRHGLSP